MDNTTLKQQIDTAITNKTAMRSITPANVGENIKATVDYIDQEIANIELTPGPQGPQGPQGPAGTDLPQTFEQLSSVSNSAPFPYPTSSVALFNSMGVSYSLIPDPLIGDIRYIRTLFACTLYASPNPGNDGANNNFITPDGNGNSSISLSAGKVYRLTYLGRFGGIWGYWNIELINTLV